MDGLLEALYDRFYTPKEMAELRRSVEANRALLRDKLPVEQRKIVLRIVDDLTMTANEGSLDSFLCGFKLAWQLTNELNHYGNGRSTPADDAGLDARSAFQKEEES